MKSCAVVILQRMLWLSVVMSRQMLLIQILIEDILVMHGLVSGLGLEIHEWGPTLHHRRTIVNVVQAHAATLAGSRMCAFITLAGR